MSAPEVRIIASSPAHIRFGTFDFDLRAGELHKNGNRIRLQQQPAQLLAILLENPGQIVTREELRQRLWSDDTFVDFEHGLNATVKRLRDALGESAGNPIFVETFPRRGYRFIAPVESGGTDVQAAAVTTSPPASVVSGPESHSVRKVVAWVVACVLLLGAGLLGYVRWRRTRQAGAPVLIRSLAVLPMQDLSHGAEKEYFSDGMTEALITELGKIRPLRVISRQSVMKYKDSIKPIPEIAKELKVDGVVEGAVLLDGSQVRISVQLIGANPEQHLWAESYERDVRDIISLQQEVARDIARQIRAEVTHQLASVPVTREALEAYLRGRFLLTRRTGVSLQQAREYFQKSIELEPRYAQAYSGLALVYILLPNYHLMAPREAVPQAKAAALKALELDPSMAEARTALAEIHSEFEWDFPNAEREFRRALQENPNYALAHQWYAAYLSAMGRFSEAIAEMQSASELQPAILGTNLDLGRAYYFGLCAGI